MPRMNILSTGEKDEFDTPPIFNSAQRKQFFETPPDLMQEINKLRKPANKIAFVMAYGYFSAGKRFFSPKRYHRSDIEYVSRKLGFSLDAFDPTLYPQRTAHYHQILILTLCGFKVWGHDTENFIYQEIRSMALSNLKPKLIFWRCVDLMIREKIQIPGYNRISDMILKVLQSRKEELTTIARSALTPDVEQLLNELFVQTETDHGQSQNSPYKLTTLKKLSQSSKPAKVNERESAYVVDGLMRNDVIKSDIHSTDTHGYSEAIFATTHMLGFSYAPRIKNLKKQSLYIFKSGQHVDKSNWHIKPDNYVNADLIIQNWDDILRLIATIKLKETSASDIFRRLNSYSRQNVLYKALKAFGQIVKSLFILRYIDDVQLRQDIEKQLNKVELSNRFTRAIAVGSPREFLHAEKEEQEIAESCNRLIKNSIICWNYLYLSQKLATAENDNNRQILLKAISTHSPMSWAHINLLGEYDFSDEKLKDSFGIKSPQMAA